MTRLRPKRCGKRASPSFFSQLAGVSGWKGTLLLLVGSLAAVLSGVLLSYRVTRMLPFYNAYVAWFLSAKLDSVNLTVNSHKDLGLTYAGVEYTTLDGFIEWSNYSSDNFFALGALALVMTFLQIFLWENVNAANVGTLRDIFFTQALRQDLTWHEQLKKESDLNTRLSVDLERVRNHLGAKTTMLIYSTASILASLVVLFLIHWIMGVITLAGLIIKSTFDLICGKLLVKQVKKEQENDRKIGYATTEVLTTFKIVKSFAREGHEVDKFSRLLKTGREYSKIKHVICSIHSAFNICSIYSLVTVFLCAGAQLIDERAISHGDYNIGYFCVMLSSLSSGNLVPVISDVLEAAASFSNLLSLKDVTPGIDPSSDGGSRPEHLRSDIHFQDVTFSYPSRRNFKVLNGLTMKIPKGQCVALVGPSGSGKSTVIDLLLRLHDPDSGKVTIGDMNIKSMNVDHLRKSIGTVMQEPVLFDATIEENIRYGNLAASAAEIQKAAEMANAHDFIMKLPNGYNTMVGERGGHLSGGQKQRVAIARALVRDPDILLLDEATSALDSHSERLIQDALERAMKGRTTIVVAHRLSTISQADFIYVLKDGFVSECGTHSELMLKLGVYFSMQSLETQKKSLEGREIIENIGSSSCDKESALGLTASSANREPPEENLGVDVQVELQTSSVRMKQILKLFLHWKSSASFIFSVIGGSYGTCFCCIYLYRLIQCFKEPLHEGSVDLYSNGLNMIYLDVGFAVIFFFAILSASLAMEDTVEYLRLGMFRQVLSRDMHFFDRTKSKVTQLANAIIQKPGQLKNIAGSKASGAVSGITLISASLIASFVTFWQLTLFQCLFFIFVLVVNYTQVKLKMKLQSSASARLKKGSKLASECFDNIKTVHCLCIQKEISESYKSIFNVPKEEFVHSIMYACTFAILSCVSYFFLGTILILGFKLISDLESSIDFMLCSGYNFQLAFASVTGLIMYYQDFGQSKQSVIDSIAQAEVCTSSDPEPSEKPVTKINGLTVETNCRAVFNSEFSSQKVLKGGIEFVDVHFSYPTSPDCSALRGFSLTVHPGQTVALVGSSGHGKSTVINLLEKFYVPGRGKIVIDGVDVRDINAHYLRDNMALVTQDPLLFNMTIRENILYGAKSGSEISDEMLFRCCQQANIYDFIMGLPERFETTVGARGSQLSGGQRQRIAIARALMRDPKILLLDEATSALDSESEKEVLDALDRVVQGRTTIVIAHRLSTIRSADVIAVVENGMVMEKGSHDELVTLKGRYFEMLRMN